jgi:trimethylamine--corrinoid protein Co-methyltransferase
MQLSEAIDELKIGCNILIPEDSKNPNPELHTDCILLQNCTKMNMAVPLNLAEAIFFAEAAAIADQDLPSGIGPTIHYAVSPTNPFQIDPDSCEVFLYAIEHNYPLLITSCPINGATSPITMVGTTVQTHAEFLSMLTIAQLLNEGIPCIYGGSGGPMDMRTGVLTYGCAERDKMLSANVDIAKFFKLPHWSACGTVDTPYPDFQAGQSKALSFLTRLMKGVTFGIWFGPLLTGKAVSPEQLILDADIYRQVVSLLNGMPLEEERFGYDAIKRVGPAGNFMMDEHTLKYIRDADEFYASPIVNHEGEQGRNMVDRAHDCVEEIIKNFQSPVPEHIQEELEKFLNDYTKTTL